MSFTWMSSKSKSSGFTSWDSGFSYKAYVYSIVIKGTNASNVIKGTSSKDTLYGRAGNDKMYGYNGNDKIKGDHGKDLIKGGNGHDKLYGGHHNDKVYGDNNNDKIYGDKGNDKLYGGKGHDKVYGGKNNDKIFGQNNNDKLYGQQGNDKIYGGSGNDKLYAGSGTDYLYGGSGTDYLYAQSGVGYLYGDSGNDYLYGGASSDTLNGGSGNDVLKGYGGNDKLYAGSGNDTVYGNSGTNYIYGDSGTNKLYGGTGIDYIFGGSGVDTITGGAGNDDIEGGEGNDTISGNDGNDEIDGDGGSDTLNGGDGDDTLNGGDGDDVLRGDDGDDSLSDAMGNDTHYGGNGNDVISDLDGNDNLFGEAGNDTLNGGMGGNNLYGGDGNDILIFEIDNNDASNAQGIYGQTSDAINATEADNDVGTDTLRITGVVELAKTEHWVYNALNDLLTHINGGSKNDAYTDLDNDSSNKINIAEIQGIDTLELDGQAAATTLGTIETHAWNSADTDFFIDDLNSNSGADNVLFLDFIGSNQDGDHITGSYWNSDHWLDVHADAESGIEWTGYDRDGNAGSFTYAEQMGVKDIFDRVAEDFSIFNLHVTTNKTHYDAIRGDADADTNVIRVVVTTTAGNIDTGPDPDVLTNGIPVGGNTGADGQASLLNFGNESGDIQWVYMGSNYHNAYLADTISHEAAHFLGLEHDGTDFNPKDGDMDDAGETHYFGNLYDDEFIGTTWGTIMGGPYQEDGPEDFVITQWDKSEYTNAFTEQTHATVDDEDDIAILADALGYRDYGGNADDHDDMGTGATATALTDGVTGIIGKENHADNDNDVFSYTAVQDGTLQIQVNGIGYGTNLDIYAALYTSLTNDLDGSARVFEADNDGQVNESLTYEMTSGQTIYLMIDGVGDDSTGYSDYGSLGQYTIDIEFV